MASKARTKRKRGCIRVKLPGGGTAILTGSFPVESRCHCGKLATRMCDWKVGPTTTCDQPICESCTTSPKPDKDLCPKHAKMWEAHPANKPKSP